MKRPGMGVMLSELGEGNTTAHVVNTAYGKTLTQVWIEETEHSDPSNKLVLNFADGSSIELYDNGQSCCEVRYMHTDDDLPYYTNTEFLSVKIQEGPEVESEWDNVKESEFLIITTGLGAFTIVNYNEHNGYYGGFSLVARNREDDY